jgi:hypothetical protein
LDAVLLTETVSRDYGKSEMWIVVHSFIIYNLMGLLSILRGDMYLFDSFTESGNFLFVLSSTRSVLVRAALHSIEMNVLSIA